MGRKKIKLAGGVGLKLHAAFLKAHELTKNPRLDFVRKKWFVFSALTLLALAPHLIEKLHYENTKYKISSSVESVISRSTVDIALIKESAEGFSYNRQEEAPQKDEPQQITVAGELDATGQSLYSATLPVDPKDGFSFGDENGDRSFSLVPVDDLSNGQLVDGSVIYPVSSSEKHIYSFRKNGIKEDIVLTKSPSKTASWQWRLNLGEELEARLLPDGSVGFFGANPYLYGDLQVGDVKSQELIDNARTKDKSYQVFAIPRPYIKDSSGKTIYEDVSFSLKGDLLTLEAMDLEDKEYPLSIDPSVVVTTTADFATGTDDGMIYYATANQIGRSTVSLGTVGATTQQTSAFTTARNYHTSVAYNGYIYIIGGNGGSLQNDIQYSWIDTSTGALCLPSNHATCSGTVFAQQTSAFTTARNGHTSVVYNGYLYIIGGVSTGPTYQNDIQYSWIDTSTGALCLPSNHATCSGTVFAQQTSAFTTARSQHTSVTYNGYLYIIGGYNGSPQNDIQYCPINADGSVGTCTQQTSAFTTARYAHTSVAYNGYLYIIGGTSGSFQNDIQYCPINANGSIGTCTQQAAAFTTARSDHTSVAYNGYLYIIGGCSAGSCSAYQNDIQNCPINANGSVGTCTQETSAFTTARHSHTSVVYNGYLYIIGGTSGTRQNDIQRLLIDTGTPSFGNVGATTQQTNAFTTARYRHASVAYNGYLYIIGGWDGATAQGDIQYCPINANGSVGTCTRQTSAFTTARHRHTAVIYKGYLYIIGGEGGAFQSDIQYCPINANGSVGTCTVNATGFTTARGSHTSVVYNDFLYIIGGCSAGSCTAFLSDIQYCQINANGSVNTCTVNATGFTTARESHASAAYNGYLYIVGGCTAGTCTTYNNDIQYCQINANGSVNACTQQAAAFTGARDTHESVGYNGYLYIIGGDTGSFQNDVQHCPFNANGSVGTCVQETAAFTTPRYDHTTVVYNGYLYLAGGYGPSAPNNDIQYLAVESPAQAAHYERVVDLGPTANTLDSIQYNGTAKCMVLLQYATAGTNGVFSALTTLSIDAVAGTTYNLTGQAAKRYAKLVFTLDDQECGGASNITDFTLNYTAYTPPATPTLIGPTSGQTNISTLPIFYLRTTSHSGGYLRYHIKVYSAQTECNSDSGTFLIRSIDQTSSQTGWQRQDQETSTAYTGAAIVGDSQLAVHNYQPTQLTNSTTYWWKSRAIDPSVYNAWTSWTTCQSFTTGALETRIQGGVDIRGGTTIQ